MGAVSLFFLAYFVFVSKRKHFQKYDGRGAMRLTHSLSLQNLCSFDSGSGFESNCYDLRAVTKGSCENYCPDVLVLQLGESRALAGLLGN